MMLMLLLLTMMMMAVLWNGSIGCIDKHAIDLSPNDRTKTLPNICPMRRNYQQQEDG